MTVRKHSRRSALGSAQGDNTISFGTDDYINNKISGNQNKSNQQIETAIVEEVISNPTVYFNKPWVDNNSTFNGNPITLGDVLSGRVREDDDGNPIASPWLLESPEIIDFIPPNSIKAFRKKSKNSGGASNSIICFPFFSSHFSLPVKPGEQVWIINIENTYYWMCRQTSYRQIEDVNFTFSQRENNVRDIKESENPNAYVHFNGGSTSGANIDFQKIMSDSLTYREEFTGEPVPRQVKGCGDFLIQGSNNSHIYLGKEKFEESETSFSPAYFTPYTNIEDSIPERKPISPAIDICILRKKSDILGLKTVSSSNDIASNPSLEGEDTLSIVSAVQKDANLRYYENEKSRDVAGKEIFFEENNDFDILNCAARVYLTNAKTIDTILGISDYQGEPDMSSSPQDTTGRDDYGTLIAFGTNARLVGGETIKIQNLSGQSGIQFTPSGDVIIFGNTSGGAKIVLEAGGDIRIVPGENGILKLGSDNAIGGLVASANSLRTEGSVESPTIVTTAGGFVGQPLSPATGIFSNKVLIAVPQV